MKILFLNMFYPHPASGGIERVTMSLSKWFSSQGHLCYSVYFKRSIYDDCWGFLHGFYLEDLKNHEIWNKIISEWKIDVIINQSHWWLTPFLANIAHQCNAKYIFCLHTTSILNTIHFSTAIQECGWKKGLAIMLTYPAFRWYSLYKLHKGHRKNYIYSDKVLLLTKSALKDYANICHANPSEKKLGFINNPLSFEKALPIQDIEKKKKIVLTVARLTKEKRINLLLDVWKQLECAGVTDWQLKIVGGGEEETRLKKQAELLHLRSISFEGVQKSERYYEESSIFCMTSKSEGFPMTILESLQMGTVPVVMNSFPAAADMIEDGKNGLLVNYGDVNDFANRLIWLMRNEDLREKMAAKAIESSQQFDIKIIGAKWQDLFSKLFL